MSELDNLSNKELLAKCREHGLPVVPITDTTRNVIIRRLHSAISGTSLKNSRKSTKSSRTVVAKNAKPSRKTIEPVKVAHGKSTTKNTVNLKRRSVPTKGEALEEAPNEDDDEEIEEPRPQSKISRGRKESRTQTSQPPQLKRGSLPATKTVSESASQASDGPPKPTTKRLKLGNEVKERGLLPLTKTSVSVTAYVHEETSSEEDTAILKRKTACGRKETGQNSDQNTDLKRRTLHTKGRSVQFAPSVSNAGCQADMPSAERETTYRKKETYTLNTRKPTTLVSSLGSQTDNNVYLKPQKTLSSPPDARARRSKLLTRTEVVTTSYIHQIETSEDDKEISSCKRRRICTSPVSCPPPIYESGFGSTFAANLNAVKPSATQAITTSPTALYAPRSTLSGSARSLREESTFSVRKRQGNDNSWPARSEGSIQPTATGSSLYPKLDHFYKQQSLSNSFRGEPMDTDSDLDIMDQQKTYWRPK